MCGAFHSHNRWLIRFSSDHAEEKQEVFKRAKGYAEERKAKVHKHGPKEGKELVRPDRVC